MKAAIYAHVSTAGFAVETIGGRGQRVRDAGQALHDAVVQIARDAAALGVGRVQGASQEALPLLLTLSEATRHRPRQGDLHEEKQQQAADHDRGERPPDVAPALGDRAVAQVGLEEQLLSADRVDGDVHLEQLVVRALVAVLGFVEVTEVGGDSPRPERGPLAIRRDA